MPPGTPSTRRCRRDGGSACRQSSNVGVSASLEHRTRGGPIVDPSPDSFPSFRLSGRSSTGLCSPRWFVRRHPQEVLDSHHAQEESNGKWHQLPRRVNEELGSAEMDPSPTRLQLRLPRRQDVLDSLDIGAVGQGEYVRIAALEDVHGCSIRIARPPPAVADQREAWQPRSEPPAEAIEDTGSERPDPLQSGRPSSRHVIHGTPRPESAQEAAVGILEAGTGTA